MPGRAAVDDDDPAEALGGGEDRRPATERARPDDDQVRAFRHRPRIGVRRGVRSVVATRAPGSRGRSAVEGGPLDAHPEHARDGPAGRTSVGAGPSRPRGRARPPGRAPPTAASMACHSAAMATQPSSTASAIDAGSRSQRFSQRGQAGALRATRSSAAGSNDDTTARSRSGPRPAARTSTTAGPTSSLSSTSRKARRGQRGEDVGQGRDAQVLERPGGQLRRAAPAGPRRARGSRRGGGPGRRRPSAGRRTRRRRRPGRPGRP